MFQLSRPKSEILRLSRPTTFKNLRIGLFVPAYLFLVLLDQTSMCFDFLDRQNLKNKEFDCSTPLSYNSTFSTKYWNVLVFSTKFRYASIFSTKFWYISAFSTQEKTCLIFFDQVQICFGFIAGHFSNLVFSRPD